jgi:hypothetical protein
MWCTGAAGIFSRGGTMKLSLRHLFFSIVTAGVLFVTSGARADTEVVRARFASRVGLDLLRTTTCGMQPVILIDGAASHRRARRRAALRVDPAGGRRARAGGALRGR